MSATSTTATLTHRATPPSLNQMGLRGSHWKVNAAKKQWQLTLGLLLLKAELPRKLDRVEASAVLRFPTRRRRDEGNFRWLLEKALGDSLVPRWLPDDTPDRYRFFGIEFDPECGTPLTTLTVIGRVG
jgi:hypothetical protein